MGLVTMQFYPLKIDTQITTIFYQMISFSHPSALICHQINTRVTTVHSAQK